MYNHGGFDWKIARDEIRIQEDNPGVDLAGTLLDGLSHMEEQTGIRSPILAKMRRRAVDSNIMRLVRGGGRPLRYVADVVQAGGNISHSHVLNRANPLARRGALRKRVKGRRVLVCGDARFPRPGWNVDRPNLERCTVWRFRLGKRPGPQVMAKLAEYVRSQGCATVGDLDGAVCSGIFHVPHDPAPAKAVRMCLEMMN